jgi:hypothetical protein
MQKNYHRMIPIILFFLAAVAAGVFISLTKKGATLPIDLEN